MNKFAIFRYFFNNYPCLKENIFKFVIIFFFVIFIFSAAMSILLGPLSNYQIYEYFSTYYISHGVYPVHEPGVVHPFEISYRDYSPLNGLIYRAIFSVSDEWRVVFFSLYQAALLSLALALAWRMSNAGILPSEFPAATAVFLLANPITFRVVGGDDKGAFLLMPLACIYAFNFGAVPAAVAIGVFAGWTGFGAATIPLLLGLPGTALRRRLELVAIATGVMVLLLAAEGSDGLVSLANRAERELLPPFWYSIGRWFPAEVWPTARVPIIAVFLLVIMALLQVKRIAFSQAFVLAASVYLLFSNNTVPTRFMFFAPLLMICFQSKVGRLRYIALTYLAIIAAYALVYAPIEWRDLLIGSAGVAICNGVLLIPISITLLRALVVPFSKSTIPK